MESEHGGDWASFAARYGAEPLDFSASISPLGLPAGVERAAADALDGACRYPDPACRALTKRLAAHHGLSPRHILCGAGAADLIYRLCYGLRPKTALLPAPSFSEYGRALAAVGCHVRDVPLHSETGFQLPRSILREITPELDLLVLCQPNNPAGVPISPALLEEILDACHKTGTRLLLDECFVPFLPEPEAHSLMAFVPTHRELVVLRAFTKIYAMPGLRLGYCAGGDPALLDAMGQAGPPWNVSSVAQAAGLAALEEDAYVREVWALVSKERPWLAEQLGALGMKVIPGAGNFLLFFAPQTDLGQRLARRGILIRDCRNFRGLEPGWYRVAVRTRPENNRLINTIREVTQWPDKS